MTEVKEKDTATVTSFQSPPKVLELPSDFAEMEAKVLRKFDLMIVSSLAIIYMFANLDKSNIGNANAGGMSKDLHLVDNQYGNAVSMLYITYCVFETPIALSLKRLGPRWFLTTLYLFFSICCLCTGFVQNYGQLLTIRLLVGLFESGIIPCINVYLSMLYTRKEMAKRAAWVFAAGAFSGAFGGLLAYGLLKLHGRGGWEGWRWMFAVEGALSISFYPVSIFLLPSHDLVNTWWLTQREREILAIRLEYYPDFHQNESFTWGEAARCFKELNNWIVMAYQFCTDLTLFGISTFLPSIIKGMGYSSYRTQLMTIPFYVCTVFGFSTVCYISDRIGHRGGFIVLGSALALIGDIILICQDSLGARYFACMLIGLSLFVCASLSMSWILNNNSGHYKRATASGMMTTVGNSAGVLAGQIFTAQSAPRYFKGLKVAMGLTSLQIVLVLVMMFNYHRYNLANKKKMQAATQQELDNQPANDESVYFKFML